MEALSTAVGKQLHWMQSRGSQRWFKSQAAVEIYPRAEREAELSLLVLLDGICSSSSGMTQQSLWLLRRLGELRGCLALTR
jgi:hypothetical protein